MRRSTRSHPRTRLAVLAGAAVAAAVTAATAVSLSSPATQASHPTASAGGAQPTASLTAAHSHGHAPPAKYYLALGDSLAAGVQPDSTGASVPTDQGYANDLYAYYAPRYRNLQLEDLGCPGETTTSMLTGTGSPCTYSQGSQLAAAVAFIKAHRGKIALVTIDIGANNVDGCATATSIDESCIESGVASIESDLPQILAAIRGAAGNGVPIAGMNLYDPFLAEYLTGTTGQTIAEDSTTLAGEINSVLAADFQADRIQTADVATAFSTTDFTDTMQLPGVGTVPLNVGRICTWTWMCAPAPVGPNIHANATGYQQIAAAFEKVIPKRV